MYTLSLIGLPGMTMSCEFVHGVWAAEEWDLEVVRALLWPILYKGVVSLQNKIIRVVSSILILCSVVAEGHFSLQIVSYFVMSTRIIMSTIIGILSPLVLILLICLQYLDV